jgi:hemerythrin-like domain-containing protein
MKTTDQLRDEHEGVKLMLAILGRAAARLETGQDVSPEDLAQMLEFITVFADKCHHGKEEELLFPAMEEAGIPGKAGRSVSCCGSMTWGVGTSAESPARSGRRGGSLLSDDDA